MPRGGKRENAGRKADPNSERQKRLRARAERETLGRGLTQADGTKSPDAPPGWPFGTAPAVPPAPPAAEPDPDQEDGLTDEQRAKATPLEYLLAVMRSPQASKSARLTAAIQAAPYMHAKIPPAAKKAAAKDAADKAAGGRFGAAPTPPRLAAANGKPVP